MKRSTHYGNNYWEGFSPKVNRNVRFFSDLEYEHWILVETNPRIVEFCEQPLRIKQFHNGDNVESIFDMWIKYVDDTEKFIEVKYSHEFHPKHKNYERVRRQTEAQRAWCKANNIDYEIQTEKEIRGNRIYLENMRYLLPIARQKVLSETDKQPIIDLLKQNKKLTIEEIQSMLFFDSIYRSREKIYRLIYEGEIGAENIAHVPLGKQTVVKYLG
jgi:hypothetical protein